MSAEWEAFLTEHGEDIQSSVTESLIKNARLFDMEDGTPAGRCEDRLGILIVMTLDEVEGLASEEWRMHEGAARHPVFKEYFGRAVQDMAVRALDARPVED